MIFETVFIIAMGFIAVAIFTGRSININITHKHVHDQTPFQQVPDTYEKDPIAGLAETISSFLEGSDLNDEA